ncbi:MAG: glutathione S-transferase family protein [Pseudomonadota bacterium]
MTNTLYIGPKNYSSWSLRPWLVLRWAGLEFAEHFIPLDQPGYGTGEIVEVKQVSPSGTVPALHVNDLVIWDSLAIAEWAAEQVPSLWPQDPAVRAQARSVTAEMHSGFGGIRRDQAMNIKRRCPGQEWPEDTARDLSRMADLWNECRARHGSRGPWLFGERCIADAFFTPVATRFRTYSVPLDEVCQRYVETLLGDADFLAWEAECVTDVWDKPGFPVIDGLYV